MGDLTKNFSKHEFSCPCCNKGGIDPALVGLLQSIRDDLGCSILINSGVRCEKHNKEVGGVSNSTHITGIGADIECFSAMLRYTIISSAMRAGVSRIGVGSSFIHIDTAIDDKHPQNVIWTY